MAESQDETQNVTKKTSGCMIVFGVLIFLSLAVIGVFGFGFYKLISSPEGKAVFKTVKVTTDLVIEMSAGQGVSAMRQMGCQQAMSVTPKKIVETLQKLKVETGSATPSQFSDISEDDLELPILSCAVEDDTTALTCKKLARGYRQAISMRDGRVSVIIATFDPLDPFSVVAERHLCSGVFDKTGARVSDVPSSFFLLGKLTDHTSFDNLGEPSPRAPQLADVSDAGAPDFAADTVKTATDAQRAPKTDAGSKVHDSDIHTSAIQAIRDGGLAEPSQP